MTTEWTDSDVRALEVILIRAKATAVYERNEAERLYIAYSSTRPSLTDRLESAKLTIATVERLQSLVRETFRRN